MFYELTISGGGQLCISYIGFLIAVNTPTERVLTVRCGRGGCLVALAWVLGVPDSVSIQLIAKHMNTGFGCKASLERLLSEWGALSSEDTVRPLIRDLLRVGVSRKVTLVNGWEPMEGSAYEDITMQQLSKLTGKHLSIAVSRVGRMSALEFITCESHPDLPVYRAVEASCAIPLVFTPVDIGGRRYCDSCFARGTIAKARGAGAGGAAELALVSGAEPPKDAVANNFIQHVANVFSVAIARICSNAPDKPGCTVATVPPWTGDWISPIFSGIPGNSVAMAYRHGLKEGRDFASRL